MFLTLSWCLTRVFLCVMICFVCLISDESHFGTTCCQINATTNHKWAVYVSVFEIITKF